jgi:hypothetical protein
LINWINSKLLSVIKTTNKFISIILSLVLVIVSFALYFPPKANATGFITTSSNTLSIPVASQATVTYTTTFTFASTTALKCIDIIFGDTVGHITLTANPSTTAPTGMTTTSAAKGSISGATLTDGNWSLYNTTNGILQYEYATGQAPTAAAVTITTTGITNPSATPFYLQIATYSGLTGHTCSTLVDNSNVMAQVSTPALSATLQVDPTLTFSVANYGSAVNGSGDTSPVTTTATTIPFGTVAGGSTAWGSQTLTVTTNSIHGYNLYVKYTAALTDSNSDTIRNQSGTPASANSFDGSTSQSSFAYTADGPGVTFGSNKWAGLTTSNVLIATRATAQASDATHIETKLQVSNVQAPGTYTTILTYTLAPSY